MVRSKVAQTSLVALVLAAGAALAHAQESGEGLQGGVEIQVLKPYHTEGQITGYDYKAAPSIWLGYQWSNGLGIRGRWWQYKGSGPASSIYTRLKMRTIDLEATQAFTLGSLHGLFSVGLRHARYKEVNGVVVPSALGFVGSIELRRALVGGFGIFGSARYAYMFENKWREGTTSYRDLGFGIAEGRLGLEYGHALWAGGPVLYGRAGAVAHYWDGMSDADTEGTGLFGASFELGVRASLGGETRVTPTADMEPGRDESGLSMGVRLLLLKPYHTEGQFTDYDRKISPLVWLAWQGRSGLGLRARWWQYNDTTNDPAASIYDRVKMRTLDVEATQTFSLGENLHGRVFGGVRFARYEEAQGISTLVVPSAWGLVGGVEIRRPLVGGLSLFGESRHALMFDNRWRDGSSQERNIVFGTTELNLGMTYEYPLWEGGAVLFGRAMAAAQLWDSVSDGDTESTSLFGYAFEAGVRVPIGAAQDVRPAADLAVGDRFAGGIDAGIAVSFLKAHDSEGDAEGYDYKASPTFWLALQGEGGLGARLRYWRYKDATDDPAANKKDAFRMRTLDVELTQAFTPGSGMEGKVSAGLRFASFREDYGTSFQEVPSAVGIQAGIELRRDLIGGLGLFGEGRYALMFDNKWSDVGTAERNIGFRIMEARAGLEYRQQLMDTGASFFGRALVDVRRWDGVSDGDSEGVSLLGGMVEAGVHIPLSLSR